MGLTPKLEVDSRSSAALTGSLNGQLSDPVTVPASTLAVCRTGSVSPTSAPPTAVVERALTWIIRRIPPPLVVVTMPPNAIRLKDIIAIIFDVRHVVLSWSTFWSRRRAAPVFNCSATGLKARRRRATRPAPPPPRGSAGAHSTQSSAAEQCSALVSRGYRVTRCA